MTLAEAWAFIEAEEQQMLTYLTENGWNFCELSDRDWVSDELIHRLEKEVNLPVPETPEDLRDEKYVDQVVDKLDGNDVETAIDRIDIDYHLNWEYTLDVDALWEATDELGGEGQGLASLKEFIEQQKRH